MLTIQNDNIIYKLGQNANENFELIDDAIELNHDYWWFHLKDYPSGHCIIFNTEISNNMIIFAANLVKQYSKLKTSKKVSIIYTQIKNIIKTKTIGQVILRGIQKKISL